MSALLSIPRAEYIIQQLLFIGSIRETDRVWVSNLGVLERDSNRGVFSAIQRTLCCQSRTKTLMGIRRIYEGAYWWLQFISRTLTPGLHLHDRNNQDQDPPSYEAQGTTIYKDPLVLLEGLKSALGSSFAGLDALKHSYKTDQIFSLEVDILKDHLENVLGNFLPASELAFTDVHLDT